MMIAPLSWIVKCPHCQHEVPGRTLFSQRALFLTRGIAICRNCKTSFQLGKVGFSVFAAGLYAFTIAAISIGFVAILKMPIYITAIGLFGLCAFTIGAIGLNCAGLKEINKR